MSNNYKKREGIVYSTNKDFVFDPVNILGKSKLAEVFMVVRMVIEGNEHADLVKAIHQQALLVEV